MNDYRALMLSVMLDVWLALGGDANTYETWMAHPDRTPADAWAQLLAAIARNTTSLHADTNPPAGPELLALLRARP